MNVFTLASAARWAVMAAFSVGFVSPGTNGRGRAGAAEYSLDAIVSAWDQRRRSISSFQYRCRLETRIPKGAYNDRASRPAAGGRDVPPTDVVLSGNLRFTVSGIKIAYHEDCKTWDDTANRANRSQFVAVFDGRETRMVMPGAELSFGGLGHGEKPNETITDANYLQAIWLWYWPTLTRIDASKFVVRDGDGYYDGRKCLILERRVTPTVRVLVYVDAARSFLPVRRVMERTGVRSVDLCVQYAPTDPGGWRVAGWTENSFDPNKGAVTTTRTGSVTDWAINQPVDDKEFSLKLPTGAHVAEMDGPRLTGDPKYFVVEKDGTRRYIPESEYGRLPAPKAGVWRRIRFGAGIAGVLALGVIVLFLSTRRKSG